MGLYQRWTATDDTKIAVHEFGAYFGECLRGEFTLAQVVAKFNLDLIEEQQCQDMLDANGGSAVQQSVYQAMQQDIQILCESGDITESVAYTRLEISTPQQQQD